MHVQWKKWLKKKELWLKKIGKILIKKGIKYLEGEKKLIRKI
jgi:hypothetical protein